MDTLGMRKKRDTSSVFHQRSKNDDMTHDDKTDFINQVLQESTLYRLLSILDNLQNGGIDLHDIADYDKNTLNYIMDLEGL